MSFPLDDVVRRIHVHIRPYRDGVDVQLLEEDGAGTPRRALHGFVVSSSHPVARQQEVTLDGEVAPKLLAAVRNLFGAEGPLMQSGARCHVIEVISPQIGRFVDEPDAADLQPHESASGGVVRLDFSGSEVASSAQPGTGQTWTSS